MCFTDDGFAVKGKFQMRGATVPEYSDQRSGTTAGNLKNIGKCWEVTCFYQGEM